MASLVVLIVRHIVVIFILNVFFVVDLHKIWVFGYVRVVFVCLLGLRIRSFLGKDEGDSIAHSESDMRIVNSVCSWVVFPAREIVDLDRFAFVTAG